MILLTPLVLGLGALLMNQVPLFDPPGPLLRAKIYLTRHRAETGRQQLRPELRPLRLAMPLEEARQRVLDACRRLHWLDIFDAREAIHAVVETPLLNFKDDVEIHLEPVGGAVLVQVRSTSRIGKGDFGANTRHILDLYQALSAHAQ